MVDAKLGNNNQPVQQTNQDEEEYPWLPKCLTCDVWPKSNQMLWSASHDNLEGKKMI